jgi:hypothetical protein
MTRRPLTNVSNVPEGRSALGEPTLRILGFERQLREDEVDESDISEFETAPAAAKARATKLKQAKRSRVRGGRNKTRSIEGTPATEVGKDVNMEDAIETGHSNEFE